MPAAPTDPTSEIPSGSILPEIPETQPYNVTVIAPTLGGVITSQQMVQRLSAAVEHREKASSASKSVQEDITENPETEETSETDSPTTSSKTIFGKVLSFSITIPISLSA